MKVRVGPLSVRLQVGREDVAKQVAARYAPYLTDAPAYASLRVDLHPAGTALDLSRVPVQVEGRIFRWQSDLCCLVVDVPSRTAWLKGRCAHPLATIEYALRCLVALTAWQKEAILVHASAVAVEEKAVLFIGPSGSGKSTAAALCPPHTSRVADDLVLARPASNGWEAWPTPFEDHPPAARPYPIGLLCLPVKASAPALLPLPPTHALAHLTQALPLVTLCPHAMRGLLPRLAAWLTTTPLVALHFDPSPAFWPLVVTALREARDVTGT